MKKFNFVFFFLSIILSMIVSIFLVYTREQVNSITEVPYGFKDSNFYTLDILGTYAPNNNIDEIMDKFEKIIKDKKIIIVSDDITKQGLGVYDSIGLYNEAFLEPQNLSNLNISDNQILVKKESQLKIYSDETHKTDFITSVNKTKFKINGYYDIDYPLYNKYYEYVYNYFSEPSLFGIHYYYTNEEVVVDNIAKLLKSYNYDVSLVKAENYNINTIIQKLFSNRIYRTCFIGILISIINICIFYYGYLYVSIKFRKIHFQFGGTSNKILGSSIKYFLKDIFLGSLVGICLYMFLFKNTYLNLSFNFVVYSFLITLFLETIIYIFIFYISNILFYKNKYYILK